MTKAVNAPLQGRTMVLEKDFVRSTEFPTDYETDLEFEWTNISELNDVFNRSISSVVIQRKIEIFSIRNN